MAGLVDNTHVLPAHSASAGGSGRRCARRPALPPGLAQDRPAGPLPSAAHMDAQHLCSTTSSLSQEVEAPQASIAAAATGARDTSPAVGGKRSPMPRQRRTRNRRSSNKATCAAANCRHADGWNAVPDGCILFPRLLGRAGDDGTSELGSGMPACDPRCGLEGMPGVGSSLRSRESQDRCALLEDGLATCSTTSSDSGSNSRGQSSSSYEALFAESVGEVRDLGLEASAPPGSLRVPVDDWELRAPMKVELSNGRSPAVLKPAGLLAAPPPGIWSRPVQQLQHPSRVLATTAQPPQASGTSWAEAAHCPIAPPPGLLEAPVMQAWTPMATSPLLRLPQAALQWAPGAAQACGTTWDSSFTSVADIPGCCDVPDDSPADASSLGSRDRRFTCKFVFGGFDLERDADFELVPRLIGRGGANMRDIAKACDGKVRIRGRGSGHREQQKGRSSLEEADVPLQIALSCRDKDSFEEGRKRLLSLLQFISMHFERYCRRKGVDPAPALFSVVRGA